MLEVANLVRKKKAFKNKWKIYKMICDIPNITIYDLSKKTGWSPGKINYHVKNLLKENLITNSEEIVNGRVNKKYSPKKVGESINWSEMKNTQKI